MWFVLWNTFFCLCNKIIPVFTRNVIALSIQIYIPTFLSSSILLFQPHMLFFSCLHSVRGCPSWPAESRAHHTSVSLPRQGSSWTSIHRFPWWIYRNRLSRLGIWSMLAIPDFTTKNDPWAILLWFGHANPLSVGTRFASTPVRQRWGSGGLRFASTAFSAHVCLQFQWSIPPLIWQSALSSYGVSTWTTSSWTSICIAWYQKTRPTLMRQQHGPDCHNVQSLRPLFTFGVSFMFTMWISASYLCVEYSTTVFFTRSIM
jgi:hypothetical protein